MRWPRVLRRRKPVRIFAAWPEVVATFHHERLPDGTVRPVLDDPSILNITIEEATQYIAEKLSNEIKAMQPVSYSPRSWVQSLIAEDPYGDAGTRPRPYLRAALDEARESGKLEP